MSGRRADVGIALLLFGAAAAFRLARLDLVVLNSDTIGPYLRAWTILAGDGLLPAPHAAESGPALYWISTAFLAGADSLHEAFARRYLLQAAVAPLMYLALAGRAGRPLAALAASLLAASPGLLQTLDSGYQGYLAPDVAAVVVACLVLAAGDPFRARPVAIALPVVPVAMMCHPFALSLLLPVLGAAALAWRDDPRRRRELLVGAALAVGLGTVRLVQLAGGPGDGYLWSHAVSNSSGAAVGEVIAAALAAIPRQDGVVAAALLVAPGLAVLRPSPAARRLGVLYAVALGSLAVAGAVIGYLQPYHARILLPFAIAVGAVAASTDEPGPVRRSLPWALAAAVLAGGAWTASRVDRPVPDLDAHAAFGEAIAADAADGRWVEFATLGTPSWGSPAALVLDGLLRGRSAEPLRRPGPLYLVVAGPGGDVARLPGVAPNAPATLVAPARPVRGDRRAIVLRFDGPSRSGPWSAGACAASPEGLKVERRAADWLAFVRPGYTDEFTSRWFAPCVR